MATLLRRYRSSTSTSTPSTSKSADILRALLDKLTAHAENKQANGYPTILTLIEVLQKVRQHVAAPEPPSVHQDDFRYLRGFYKVLDVLRSFSGFYDPQTRTQSEKEEIFGLLEAALDLLSAAFQDHPGNKRYFRNRVESGGWEALEQIIASIGLAGSDSDTWTNSQVFGKLLAFSLGDKRVGELFHTVFEATSIAKNTPPLQNTKDGREIDNRDHVHGKEDGDVASRPILDVAGKVRKAIHKDSVFRIPEILRTVVGFWETIPRAQDRPAEPVSMTVLDAVSSAVSVSMFNLAALHSTGVLSRFLRVCFDPAQQLNPDEKQKLLVLCKKLMYLGTNQPADAQFLLANQSPEASTFSLEMASAYSGPPFFQLDLSLHGHSSIELPTLGRVFPPSNAPGYTFTAWVRIDRSDPASHTTLFGACDSTQTCFLLIYLEKDTRNFILQTSVKTQRPSVRFKSVVFKERQWYHIALVHKRPKTISASKASLYINGEFAEQLKCAYPMPPPSAHGSTDSLASFTSSNSKPNPVQAFIGTPKGLASRLGPGQVFSKWSLASAHLIEDALSDDLIAVHHGLGARYQGNYQDSLGGFQTYEASANLGLRNEIVHPGRDEASDLLRAIREKAGTLVPESKSLLSIFPTAVFREDGLFQDTQLHRALPRAASTNLIQMTQRSGSAIAVNAAVPSLPEALARSHGVAVLIGNPVVAAPSHFDDNFWRLAGFTPLALKLVDRASAVEEVVRAVEMLFLCIKRSWRNSEAMERDNGYAILGMLLRAKLGYSGSPGIESASTRLSATNEERDQMSFQLLSLLLEFVGYNHAEPLDSFIINPLAYRVLLIDFDTWRRSAPITQELYYKQFVTFSVKSKYRQFNSRRLIRMRIVKRLLDAMKAETISEDVLPHFMDALEQLVKCNYTAEVHRALALFITYTFHSPASSLPRTPKPVSSSTRSSTPGFIRRAPLDSSSSSTPATSKFLTKKQLGTKILGMYSGLLCEKGNLANIKKFARTVTNKVRESGDARSTLLSMDQWLLYLLAEDDAETVVYGAKILARLLVTHGSAYTTKFATKTAGFTIMAYHLKRWWDVPTLWPICLSILFGYDVAEIDFTREFDFSNLIEMFGSSKIATPESLPVITSMLQSGLKDIFRHQEDPSSPPADTVFRDGRPPAASLEATRPRATSMELFQALQSRRTEQMRKPSDWVVDHVSVLNTVVRFFSDLHSRSSSFRDLALSSEYVRQLLRALYPVVVSTDELSPETELNSPDATLTFEGADVIIRPLAVSGPSPIIRTASVQAATNPRTISRGRPLRRASSFILVTSQAAPDAAAPPLWQPSDPKNVLSRQTSSTVREGLLELVTDIFTEQLLNRKEFPGFSLFAKIPPGFQEHQAYFESYVLRNTIEHLNNYIQRTQKILCEPKVLMNMARFSNHVVEAIFEGWFMDGAEVMLEFLGTILEYLQRPEVSSLKSVRLCSQALATIRHCFLRINLLRLSELDDAQTSEGQALAFMHKILYWQTAILGCLSNEHEFVRLLWYQLYTKLVDDRAPIRLAAANILRIMLVQKPDESTALFRQGLASDEQRLTAQFSTLTEVDNETFVVWVDQHRPSLDAFFFGGFSKTWEEFVAAENQRTVDSAKLRLARRKECLKTWQAGNHATDNAIVSHQMANSSWMKSIFNSEHFKHQRLMQDQQDDMAFLSSAFAKMDRDLRRPGAVFSEPAQPKWKLDRTEGRNRMRLRLLPVYSKDHEVFQPKRRAGELAVSSALKVNTLVPPVTQASASISATPTSSQAPSAQRCEGAIGEPETSYQKSESSGSDSVVAPEDDFEMVDDPNDALDGDDGFEDKNRKVMRRLQQGDQVQSVYNISRIIGLEACEGILIVGREAMYIMDNVFQCASGEIVNAWQAPPDERDPFSEIITDIKTTERRQNSGRSEQESRSWRWHDVISVSKRRFLFRDVAIEIFFTDGRSYLLTTMNPVSRDSLFGKLMNKAPHTNAASSLPNPEDGWRLETLKVMEEPSQTLGFGSKFGNIFNTSSWNPSLRRWQKGEISNFHYLMLVNTMAGRTFNDLTQYPVFPWVLADYTSEELNLDDPATFRDLSKPMGAQTSGRVTGFQESYKALAEIGETPFHYGTHYSSAMIVSSYLIRLPPFVQSYILLQGGTFDHADRLFQSIPQAWKSASCENKADVRELIPEFFCLPEFLTNTNGYNFGHRESSGARVDNVVLPPWAKGDPKIFIAKHREALESPFVSRNLHHWIDLIFGYKQRGEAAVESLNVFHYLSYRGAADLDSISDPQERRIAAGVIHNFGQTPHQVFAKPHPQREVLQGPARKLDTSVYALTRLPHPLLESQDRISSLLYAPKLDRLLCASAFRLNVPPYDKWLEWGYADNSVRFFFSDNRKPAGLFENLHIGQISCVTFANSKTLITAGEDCVISVFAMQTAPGRPVELLPRSSLFGHKAPVTTIAVSKTFSTFVSISADGQAFMWDINRLEFIRKLPLARQVECASINDVTGDLMLCCGPNVVLYNINGSLMLDQNVCMESDDFVHSCAFYEGSGNEWLQNQLIITGHRRGRVNIWRKCVKNGKWTLELLRRLDHVDQRSEAGLNYDAGITCITPMPHCVYTGDEDGRVFEWSLLHRDR
ncbi:WD repeat and FYVE domain-containing protein [Sodiomyces alkalinus F11]|uniref:Beige protein homolog 1 n=1 Tax=Sodiomyces alkalinus (strain CBS 110278 / VKM F-3762 / F11) TaxID=1314773 RepID=A0A3N2Q2F3_SODAK|nr:WD repeat and FYVE domain-containing protein [Sodiomyces alkalinus F11]ROT40949.1 WD repeat and FYVE domain-containing protein [Sodiomyces alkalinus F11]